ncbi:DNJC9 protein, partial [Polypterus senegalus]
MPASGGWLLCPPGFLFPHGAVPVGGFLRPQLRCAVLCYAVLRWLACLQLRARSLSAVLRVSAGKSCRRVPRAASVARSSGACPAAVKGALSAVLTIEHALCLGSALGTAALGKIYAVLSDKDQRAIYDEQGIVDEESDTLCQDRNWEDYWRLLFPKKKQESRSREMDSFLSQLEAKYCKKENNASNKKGKKNK